MQAEVVHRADKVCLSLLVVLVSKGVHSMNCAWALPNGLWIVLTLYICRALYLFVFVTVSFCCIRAVFAQQLRGLWFFLVGHGAEGQGLGKACPFPCAKDASSCATAQACQGLEPEPWKEYASLRLCPDACSLQGHSWRPLRNRPLRMPEEWHRAGTTPDASRFFFRGSYALLVRA